MPHMELTRKEKGDIGELKAMTFLYEQGYEIFVPLFANGETDIIISKENTLYRVSVKFTSCARPSGNWRVVLANTSIRSDGSTVKKQFDASKYDFVVVYIQPEDRVIMIPANTIITVNEITVPRMEDEASRLLVPRC